MTGARRAGGDLGPAAMWGAGAAAVWGFADGGGRGRGSNSGVGLRGGGIHEEDEQCVIFSSFFCLLFLS